MKKLSVIAAAALTVMLAASCSGGPGWVKVKGNKFIDPDGII